MSENASREPKFSRASPAGAPHVHAALSSLGLDALAGLVAALIALSYAAGYGAMIFTKNPSGPHVFADLDNELEWIETRLLNAARAAHPALAANAGAFASTLPETLDALRPHLETLTLAPGEYVFRQADPGDSICFVETGRVTVALSVGEGRTLRLRSFGAGTIVGEMAVYTGARRSADVVADEPTVVLRLAVSMLKRLETDDPALAARMHKFVARVLAARLVAANEQIRTAQ
ncbi:Crp/Fnr family transcriptional regulator [Caballeronia ptereochthonis]|uniref:Acetyltransferase Pat n=1 Tax=Caballeronia ptereochthonis TaxID=1777144 RepID=A0A158AAC5_9BURK|nr:cyclic nucleotide-binding domain-containing protein [Caballeronia ptereochthonis]SAK54743.1 Acetyltransferase Pat [Caballeronia ptereochthonis]